MTDAPFVREALVVSQPAPGRRGGVVTWLRANLFSSPLNAVLTILALFGIYQFVMAVLPWLSNGVWNAGSLRQCRDIVAASAGPDATGACWAMIASRWNQFLFGLYPPDEYWRPATAAALLFVALAPILYFGLRRANALLCGGATLALGAALPELGADRSVIAPVLGFFALFSVLSWFAPKRLVWASVLYPFVACWLLWGGSVWAPVGTLLGFVLAIFAWRLVEWRYGTSIAAIVAAAAALVWWMLLQALFVRIASSLVPLELAYVRSDVFGGFLLAFLIGIAGIALSLPIGVVLALGRQSRMFLVRTLCVGFIEFIRGVPLITVLFSANFLLLYFLPPGTNFDLILRVIIVVVIFSSAYIAEVVRGGLAAVPTGQYEAADSLGLDYWQAQRLIVMPQALKISIPGIVSSFISLFKDTTLVALVGLMDPLQGVTKVVRADMAWRGIYWEPYIFVGGVFFLVCFGMSRYSLYLERKLKTDHR